MVERIHLPCPYIACGSSDAFDYNEEKQIGMCRSCCKAYPSKGMKLHDWVAKEYPLKGRSGPQKEYNEVVELIADKEDYFAHRGVSAETMRFYRVLTRFNEAGDALSHKYVYPDGGNKIRVFPKSFHVANFKSDQLFGMQLFNAGSAKAVTVVEGELDALSAYQMLGSKYPVVSLPSASPSKKLLENCKDWLGSFEKIYLSLDADDKAEAFAMQLMRLFPNRVFKVNHDKFKDANEFLQGGAAKEYNQCWWNAGLFTPDNIYATEDDFLKLLHDSPDYSYVPTGIKALDDKILGLMQGHFTVIKAGTGLGKTEFMRLLEYNLVKNHPQVKFAVCHLEETKLRSLLGIVSYALNDNVTRRDMIDSKGKMTDVEEAIKDITSKSGYMQFHLREEDGPDEVIEQIRLLTQVYGCQYVFLDPFQDIVSCPDEKSKESLLADLSVRFSKIAADLNVGLIALAHTNDNGQVKYCRMIEQRASVVISIDRDKTSEDMIERNTTRLTVEKNRPCGVDGEAGELIFDLSSFTLREKLNSW